MRRTAQFIVIATAFLLSMGQQRRPPALTPDPATDLVRVRAFVTTTAARLDLTVDGAALGGSVLKINSGLPTLRLTSDRNTMSLTGNLAGIRADVAIDIILAGVPPRATVGWNISTPVSAVTSLDIRNANVTRSQVPVDRFETTGASARLTTNADLLRAGGPLGHVEPVPSRLVLAFFYPWFDLTTWSTQPFIDLPLQPYSTDSSTDLTRLMTQARGAGLDALLMSWSGKDFNGGIDHRRMMACLAAASAAGMKVGVLFETTVANPQHLDSTADPDTIFRWLTDVVDDYASQPAYLRVGDRPVVLAYAAQRMSQAGWADALGRLRASGREVLLVGEGNNTTRLGALDGLFYYASNVYQGDEIRDFDLAQSLAVRTYHLLPDVAPQRRIWVATVSPGYDDRQLLDGRVARVSDREGGRYYERQWQAALDMRADWIVVTSWNEWWESTQIEPSIRYGDLFLRLTKSWSERFRMKHAVSRS